MPLNRQTVTPLYVSRLVRCGEKWDQGNSTQCNAKNGIIERGRPLDAVGAHCWHHTATSIGINLVGDFEQAEPTNVQLDSVLYTASMNMKNGFHMSDF